MLLPTSSKFDVWLLVAHHCALAVVAVVSHSAISGTDAASQLLSRVPSTNWQDVMMLIVASVLVSVCAASNDVTML